MGSRRVALACLLGLLLAGCATTPTPMLWKVGGKGGTVYLLGSMHFLKDDDYPLSADVNEAYRRAGRVVFEVPPAEMTSPATAALMTDHGYYTDSMHTLQDDLPAPEWKLLVAYGEKNNLPQATLQQYKPWLLSMTLAARECEKIGMRSQAGLDAHFMTLAQTDNKPTSGLETVDRQLAIFYNLPVKDQTAMLEQDLDGLSQLQGAMRNERDTWRRGDGEVLAAQAKAGLAKFPELYRQLIVQRNHDWVPQIEKMLGDPGNGVLVIVGALHLAGPDGVVSLLRKDGYTVDRICTGCGKLP